MRAEKGENLKNACKCLKEMRNGENLEGYKTEMKKEGWRCT